MAYDKDIEAMVAEALKPEAAVTAKKMFGGVGYLYRGNMAFGILNDCLIVRLGSQETAQAQIDSGKAFPFDTTGRPMKGWVMVPKAELASLDDCRAWLKQGLAFAKSLPPK